MLGKFSRKDNMKTISEIKTCDDFCEALKTCDWRAMNDAQHENIKAVWEALRHPIERAIEQLQRRVKALGLRNK
jgi:hypothetical protein